MLDQTQPASTHRRHDRCPGLTRPWLAEDGALVRIRLVGGRLPTPALGVLSALAQEHGDGRLHLTSRANVQVRGVPHDAGTLPGAFVAGVRGAGLVPSTTHELVRNIMVSPLSGRLGGRADMRPVAAELDRLLLADPVCAGLAGRFLFVLDDGRGDLVGRTSDLAAVALDGDTVQLRAGREQWGPVVARSVTAGALHDLARRFLDVHGTGPSAAWHVDELDHPLVTGSRVPRAAVTSGPPAYGPMVQDDGRIGEHVPAPDGLLVPALVDQIVDRAGGEVVLTPWRSLLLPDLDPT